MRFLICVATIILLFTHNAYSEEIKCPKYIEVQEGIKKLPAYWDFIIAPNAKRYLYSVLFTQQGEENSVLHYDDEKTRKGITTYSYWFPDKKIIYKIICTYSDTHVELIKNLPLGTKQCDATYDAKMPDSYAFKKVECFDFDKH